MRVELKHKPAARLGDAEGTHLLAGWFGAPLAVDLQCSAVLLRACWRGCVVVLHWRWTRTSPETPA